MNRKKLSFWIEAMRLRTLPVSVAGVVMACGLALMSGGFRYSACCLPSQHR